MSEQATVTNPGWSTSGLAGARFAPVRPEDEFLHPVPPGAGYAHTETSYWGFCVPERRLMAEIYIWFHPVLGTMSAGILIFTGKRASSLASRLDSPDSTALTSGMKPSSSLAAPIASSALASAVRGACGVASR